MARQEHMLESLMGACLDACPAWCMTCCVADSDAHPPGTQITQASIKHKSIEHLVQLYAFRIMLPLDTLLPTHHHRL